MRCLTAVLVVASSLSSACAQPTGIKLAVDNSLDPHDYIAMGLPAPDRSWSPNDYQRAAAVLGSIVSSDPSKLPRFASRKSGPIFARLIASDNISLVQSAGSQAIDRLQFFSELLPAVGELAKVYVSATNRQGSFDAELVELMLFTISISDYALVEVDAFIPTLDPAEPSYPARMDGLQIMRSGLASVASGALETLTEKQVYRPEVLRHFAIRLREHLPSVVRHLSEASRLEVNVRLRRMATEEQEPGLRSALEALQAAVSHDTSVKPAT